MRYYLKIYNNLYFRTHHVEMHYYLLFIKNIIKSTWTLDLSIFQNFTNKIFFFFLKKTHYCIRYYPLKKLFDLE